MPCKKADRLIPGLDFVPPTPYPCIYALCDPDNDDVRYVGQTMGLYWRYWVHINKSYENERWHAPVARWIHMLRTAGKMPTVKILEIPQSTDRRSMLDREFYWMKTYAPTGKLLNVWHMKDILANITEGV